MNPRVTALVPIKKHSERLPRKNFRDFNERPLYHWILETLQSVREIDRIVVNTDADKILRDAEDEFDIEVSKRPKRFLGDPTTRNIIQYEVDRLNSDIFIQTYCTSPLLESSTISDAIISFLNAEGHDSLMTVTRHNKRLYDETVTPINHDPTKRQRTQDLNPVFEDNSTMYIYRETLFERDDHTVGAVPVGSNPMIYEMDKIEALDIDMQVDFEMAEYFHRRRRTVDGDR